MGYAVDKLPWRLLLEMAARLDLEVANVGSVPTYRRPGYGSSIPDVTFVSACPPMWVKFSFASAWTGA